jgi:aspartate 1-decarboxylase
LNGAAARLVQPGDSVIIIAYTWLDQEEAKTFEPKVVFVDENNKITETSNEEKHGDIK